MLQPIALSILEPSQTGAARRKAAVLTSRLGFNEVKQGNVGIVVTEIANNLVRHASNGQLLLRPIEQAGVTGLEVLALDQGPGMDNLAECLRDGFSTAGTAGCGLGAMHRLSDLCEIYSVPEQGTAVLCQFWAGVPKRLPQAKLEIGVVCLPKSGEEVSGDAWAVEQCDDRYLLLVSDGLGHGPLAAEASQQAIRVFQAHTDLSSPEMMKVIHAALRSTRGAALAIAEISLQQRTLHYTGIGNIAGSLVTSERSTSMVSHNGTVGHEVRKIQAFPYTWMPGGLLIMHSDGLRTQWRLDRYPGLIYKHPSLIAGILYRDFNRGRDDVTVLVAREVN